MIPGTMIPYVLGLGVPELLIILAVVLLLFGGARLAGIGKSTGRAIKEFKEETKGLKEGDKPADQAPPPAVGTEATYQQQPPAANTTDSAGSDPRRDV
jgi:sec-independent protein translocase protein TatA